MTNSFIFDLSLQIFRIVSYFVKINFKMTDSIIKMSRQIYYKIGPILISKSLTTKSSKTQQKIILFFLGDDVIFKKFRLIYM